MLKGIGAAQHHPTNRTIEDFRTYWGEGHGPMGANLGWLRRYVQHLTIPEAYGIDPAPTFDGVSMFWMDDLPSRRGAPDAREAEMGRAVRDDDMQCFDRTVSWPTHHKRAAVTATEHIIVDGPTTPDMVKAIFIAGKLPGLSLAEFFDHWENYHGALGARVPGLRRYVQNHGLAEAYATGNQTHDGWSELWFDDLASLHRAVASPQWQELREDGATLFAGNMGIGVAREKIQKEFDWTYNDWGVPALDEDGVRRRLEDYGFSSLAADKDAARRIKEAADHQALAVFSREHVVTIDESRIDARPDR